MKILMNDSFDYFDLKMLRSCQQTIRNNNKQGSIRSVECYEEFCHLFRAYEYVRTYCIAVQACESSFFGSSFFSDRGDDD